MFLTKEQFKNLVAKRPKIKINKPYTRGFIITKISKKTGLPATTIRQILLRMTKFFAMRWRRVRVSKFCPLANFLRKLI